MKVSKVMRPNSSNVRTLKERRRECKLNKLRNDLERNTLDRKWDLIVKAGEINKWALDKLEAESEDNK